MNLPTVKDKEVTPFERLTRITTTLTILDKINNLLSGHLAYYTGQSEEVLVDVEELRYQRDNEEDSTHDKLSKLIPLPEDSAWLSVSKG